MSLTILHGENTVQSRQKLLDLEGQAKAQGQRIKRLDAKNLSLAELESVLGGISLFAEDQLLVIEELHSLPKSTRQKDLISLISQATQPIILWEKRALTKTMLNQFGSPISLEFKVSSNLFKWLDSLSPSQAQKKLQQKLLVEALAQDDEQLCFLMLQRQIRMLIQTKAGGQLKGAPFMITKLQRQAQPFSLDQLLTFHAKLLDLDLRQKTSTSWQSLSQELAILTYQL